MRGKLILTLVPLFIAGHAGAVDLKVQAETWMNDFKMADLDYSGGLSKAELDKPTASRFKFIARHFNKIDVNRDGQVTPKEYTDYLVKVRESWLAAFKAADTNYSGGLSRTELDRTKPNEFKSVKKNFDAMDSNKDGQVSVDERDSYSPAAVPTTAPTVAAANWQADFKKYDVNDSGGLSKVELAKVPANLFNDLKLSFDKADTDKDGQVTVAEYTAFQDGDDEEADTGILPFLLNMFK